MESILIAIPTHRRPKRLDRCLTSMAQLTLPPQAQVALLVADNDADGSARAQVQAFAARAPFAVHYSIAAERGLCKVRNHIFEWAIRFGANYIATCDDDNAVAQSWLAELYAALTKARADSCEGIEIKLTHGQASDTAQRKRKEDDKIKIVQWHSTSNILIHERIYKTLGLRFDLTYNFTGSEDEEFFRRAGMHGAKMIRARRAIVHPDGIEKKQTLRWIITGNYCRFAQRTHIARRYKTKSIEHILILGVCALVGGIILLPLCPLHPRIRFKTLRLLIKPVAYTRGLFGPCSVKLYADIAEQ